MMKIFATATALTALAIAPAVAQGTMKSPQKPSDMPAAQAPAKPDAAMNSDATKSGAAMQKSDATKSDATKSDAAQSSTSTPSAAKSNPAATAETKPSAPSASAGSAKPKIVSQQTPDEWLASSFKGTDVIGPDQKKIGDVSDVLFDKDGEIKAYVVGVGGFLGIGAKDVAISPSSFEVVTGDKANEKKLKLSMTADELKQAETFKPYKAPAATGQTTGMSKGPSGTPPRSK